MAIPRLRVVARPHDDTPRELETFDRVPPFRRVADWLAHAAAYVADRLRLPGAVRPCEIEDPVTGDRISISVGPRFTRLAVNGRDYYFERVTGTFDGTGSGCA